MFCTCCLACAWLGVQSYVMLEILGNLGLLFHIQPLLMGITLSSIGTARFLCLCLSASLCIYPGEGASLPTLWSSVVVSRQGLGDMAVSNAIGASTFCFFVGVVCPFTHFTNCPPAFSLSLSLAVVTEWIAGAAVLFLSPLSARAV